MRAVPGIRRTPRVALLIIVVAGAVLSFDARRLPSPDEARELAIGTFERYAKGENMN